MRPVEFHLAGAIEKLEAEGRLQQAERSRARPGLRRAGDRILSGRVALEPGETAVQLRQPAQIHVGGGLEQRAEHLRGRPLQAVAREAHGDQAVVVRPDRAVVIGHRVVARLR